MNINEIQDGMKFVICSDKGVSKTKLVGKVIDKNFWRPVPPLLVQKKSILVRVKDMEKKEKFYIICQPNFINKEDVVYKPRRISIYLNRALKEIVATLNALVSP